MPLPTIQFRYRPAKNELQLALFGCFFCPYLGYMLLFEQGAFPDIPNYVLWVMVIGGTIMSSICLLNYVRGGRIIILMNDALIIPASYYLSLQRSFLLYYTNIEDITEKYRNEYGTPEIFITVHNASKRYLTEKIYVISSDGFADMRQYRDFITELRKRVDSAHF